MTIARKALLIASPSVAPALPGTLADVRNFRGFLTSLHGGAWDEREIVTLVDPSRSQLLSRLREMRDADYAFITFGGHGYHLQNGSQSDTKICLTESDSCLVYEVNPGNKRHFVAVDSCRGIVEKEFFEERFNALENFSARARIDREFVRDAFDKAVMAAEEGRVVAYSCGINQDAGDNSRLGGVFSNALTSEAMRWSMSASGNAVLSVTAAFESAKTVTLRRNSPQRPELEAGRRLRSFPFAIGSK
jgi:hypothetical protein